MAVARRAPSGFGLVDLTQIVAWQKASRERNLVAVRRGPGVSDARRRLRDPRPMRLRTSCR
jgi:hypothetical protein